MLFNLDEQESVQQTHTVEKGAFLLNSGERSCADHDQHMITDAFFRVHLARQFEKNSKNSNLNA